MMSPSSPSRRSALPVAVALLALAAGAPAGAWAQAPPAPPGPPPGNGSDLPAPPGTAPAFVPPGTPGAVPGGTTGPGLLGNASVACVGRTNDAGRPCGATIGMTCQSNSVRLLTSRSHQELTPPKM